MSHITEMAALERETAAMLRDFAKKREERGDPPHPGDLELAEDYEIMAEMSDLSEEVNRLSERVHNANRMWRVLRGRLHP